MLTWNSAGYKRGIDVEIIKRNTENGAVYDVFMSNPYIGTKRVDIFDKNIMEVYGITEANMEEYVDTNRKHYLYKYFHYEEIEDASEQDPPELLEKLRILNKYYKEQDKGIWRQYKYGYTVEVTEQETLYGLRYDLYIFNPDYGKKRLMFSLHKGSMEIDLIDFVLSNNGYFFSLYESYCCDCEEEEELY